MKKTHTRTIWIMGLTLCFTLVGILDINILNAVPELAVESALASDNLNGAATSGDAIAQGDAVFSWSTIFFLLFAIFAIVTFRRNIDY